MDFGLALACVDPTSHETELDHQSCHDSCETSSIHACNLCGDDSSDPRDAPCCGATVCAKCVVTSAAAGPSGELRCPACNSDCDYYVSYAASYGAHRPLRPRPAPVDAPAEPRYVYPPKKAKKSWTTCVIVVSPAPARTPPPAVAERTLDGAPRETVPTTAAATRAAVRFVLPPAAQLPVSLQDLATAAAPQAAVWFVLPPATQLPVPTALEVPTPAPRPAAPASAGRVIRRARRARGATHRTRSTARSARKYGIPLPLRRK